jgi:hypothetical protein
MCVAEGAVCVYTPLKPRQSAAAKALPGPSGPANVEMPEDDELDDLGSQGFHAQPTSELGGQSSHEPSHMQTHYGEHLPEPEQVTNQTGPPAEDFSQAHHDVYQQSSALSFPHVGAEIVPQPSNNTSATAGTAPMEYIPNQVLDAPENPSHGFSYPAPPAEPHNASLRYMEQTSHADDQGLHGRSAGQAASSRRSLPVA